MNNSFGDFGSLGLSDGSDLNFDDLGMGLDNETSDSNDQYNFDSSDNLGDPYDLDDMYDDDLANNQNNDDISLDPVNDSKKKSIIMACIGVAAIFVILILAILITRAADNRRANTGSLQEGPQVATDKNANDILGTNYNPNNTSKYANNNTDWIEITSGENVVFSENYAEMTFTITNIKHLTRVVDTNKNLVIKTTLQGSISGLPGTYELDIPYNKGVKLVVGSNFTVYVQLGSFNGKTVVGEIRY